MPVVDASTDVERRQIVLVSELAASPERVWDLWASPRRLERWWGPPGVPMTIESHDLRDGGQVRFHVDLSSSTRINARFEIVRVDPPRALRFTFHTEGLEPSEVDVTIEELRSGRCRMTITVELPSDEAMRRAIDIGFDRGLRRSAARLDDALDL